MVGWIRENFDILSVYLGCQYLFPIVRSMNRWRYREGQEPLYRFGVRGKRFLLRKS
jgi:hypothetical protein